MSNKITFPVFGEDKTDFPVVGSATKEFTNDIDEAITEYPVLYGAGLEGILYNGGITKQEFSTLLTAFSKQIVYQVEKGGVPDWDEIVNYSQYAFVRNPANTSQIYLSKVNDNLNNLLSDTDSWVHLCTYNTDGTITFINNITVPTLNATTVNATNVNSTNETTGELTTNLISSNGDNDILFRRGGQMRALLHNGGLLVDSGLGLSIMSIPNPSLQRSTTPRIELDPFSTNFVNSPPRYGSDPSNANDLCRKSYVDAQASGIQGQSLGRWNSTVSLDTPVAFANEFSWNANSWSAGSITIWETGYYVGIFSYRAENTSASGQMFANMDINGVLTAFGVVTWSGLSTGSLIPIYVAFNLPIAGTSTISAGTVINNIRVSGTGINNGSQNHRFLIQKLRTS